MTFTSTLFAFTDAVYINGRSILDYVHSFAQVGFYFFLYLMVGLTTLYLLFSLYALIRWKKTAEQPLDLTKAPFVTIQIPTRNELIALRCAEHCLAFNYPKDKYEIIIGDDSNDRKVSHELRKFAREHASVRVLKRKENIGYKPGNLNNMLKYSNGEIIVIFDSDFVPEPDFLKRIVAPFAHDGRVAIVQARWNFNNFDQNLVTILASTIVYTFHNIVLSILHRFGTASLCGSAEAVRKKDLVALGGWKSGSLTEDIEYALRLFKNGKKMVYLPTLECYSEVPYKAQDLYKQQMRWAYGVITSYKTHLKDLMLSKKLSLKQKTISLAPGFGYLLPMFMAMIFLFGILSLVTHRPAPLDLERFFREFFWNTLLTSGLLIASMVALLKAKKLKYTLKMIASSFSFGIITTYYVNKGIFKSLMNKPMQWFLLSKDVPAKRS